MSGIDIAALRRMVTTIEGNDPQGSFANQGQTGFGRARSFTLGLAGADAAFPHGLAGDALHEVFAENPGAHMAATGFALAFAARSAARATEHAAEPRRPIIWIEEESASSEYGGLYPPGLHAFGIDPSQLLIVRCPTAQDVLKAANDALEAGSGG